MLFVSHVLKQLEEFSALLRALERGASPAVLSGLSGVHRAHVAAETFLSTGRPVLMICSDDTEAARMAADLGALTGREVVQIPARELVLRDAVTVSHQWEHRRLEALLRIAQGEAHIMVATVDALLQRTMPPDTLRSVSLTLKQDDIQNPDDLLLRLSSAGYSRCQQVEGPGQFAARGGILDVFSPGADRPVRLEFFGDQVDAMGVFDPDTQRRTDNISSIRLLPAAEALPELSPNGRSGLCGELSALRHRIERRGSEDHGKLLSTLDRDLERIGNGIYFPALDRYLSLIYPNPATTLDYLPSDTVFFFSESSRIGERARGFLLNKRQDVETLLEDGLLAGELSDLWLDWPDFCEHLSDRPVAYLDSFPVSSYPLPPHLLLALSCKQLPSFGGSLEAAADDLKHYEGSAFGVVVLCPTERRVRSLHTLLREHGLKAVLDLRPKKIPEPGQIMLAVGTLSAGMEYPGARFALLTEGQQAAPQKRAAAPVAGRQKLAGYADLSTGDLVVHVHHGIGRFVELVKMPVDGVVKDYVKLAYAGSDSLYLPATQLDMISKFIGGGEESAGPKLSKLGGTDWARAKSKAKAAAKDLAKGLIALYAERQRISGHAFPPDTLWQTEFEESFDYQETVDQLSCVAEVKHDMERPIPMDRLLCGDVGYGKTEVALRAIMKCVMDGKQAAFLVPTTVLAQQHFLTAVQRFSHFPIQIDVMSRFRTPVQQRQTLRRLADGDIDLLIGTHRLLQKDIRFKDLGLLVIDEEQRFGVTHKERLKEMARQVDVLTLTATPIPRTLNMALSGIRDMSTIEVPPQNRQPVQTYVLEHDWSVLADAISRELQRNGQVYYLHNRVETIDRTAARIAELFPDATVGVAHGRLGEEALNRVMQKTVDGEISILVCTTIVETGIDIPNVNTLIIEDADHLGLAQLHQIRGRVGRSARRAYAYMTYRSGKILTEVAAKRLSAIREFAAFGSGFKIAMRDLEIRGAGNVLGPEQSGYMMSVGYDMYLKLLEEAVLEERGQQPKVSAECTADLTLAANIPDCYIPSPEQRMDFYRRIARLRTMEDADDLRDELMDRFGAPPKSVEALLSVALLRADAAEAGIAEISQRENHLNFSLSGGDALQRVSLLCAAPHYRGRLLFSAGERPYLSLRIKKGDDVLTLARELIRAYTATSQPPVG